MPKEKSLLFADRFFLFALTWMNTEGLTFVVRLMLPGASTGPSSSGASRGAGNFLQHILPLYFPWQPEAFPQSCREAVLVEREAGKQKGVLTPLLRALTGTRIGLPYRRHCLKTGKGVVCISQASLFVANPFKYRFVYI